MEFSEAILLGLIQGVAEWLPISSEAMVTLAGRFLLGTGYQESLGTAIWLHSGTAISALVYFRNDVADIVKGILSGEQSLLFFLAVATAATAVSALPLLLLAFVLDIPDWIFTIAIGLFLVVVAWLQKKRASSDSESLLPPGKAAIAGVVQGFAVLPGLSRSGLTIAALLYQNYSLGQAMRLSFLMSIPVTLGIQVFLPFVSGDFSLTPELVVGSAAAAVAGLATISALMRLASTVSFFRATLGLGIVVIILGLAMLL
jgi:undecaprenyl-diphosphatase